MTEPTTWFTRDLSGSVLKCTEQDDFLHREINRGIAQSSATETQGHLFSIPEEAITCMGYIWHHPNLNALTGGCMTWQGKKTIPLGCELMDMRSFMSDAALEHDLGDYTLDTGYRAIVIEPLKKFRMLYEDKARGNAFDVELTAVMPPAMANNGRHFEQAMRTRGELTLRGKRYKVDGYSIRDRSWGEARSEAIARYPSIGWLNGIFGDDFAFSCTIVDHPDLDPIWKGRFDVPPGETLLAGWVWRDGEVLPIATARKKTHYDTRTLNPDYVTVEFADTRGNKYEAVGTAVNAASTNCWMNINAPVFLARWECNGRKGWGESQDIQWNDFTQAFLER